MSHSRCSLQKKRLVLVSARALEMSSLTRQKRIGRRFAAAIARVPPIPEVSECPTLARRLVDPNAGKSATLSLPSRFVSKTAANSERQSRASSAHAKGACTPFQSAPVHAQPASRIPLRKDTLFRTTGSPNIYQYGLQIRSPA